MVKELRYFSMGCVFFVLVLLNVSLGWARLPAYDSQDPLLEHSFEMGMEIGGIRYKEPSLGVEFKGMVSGIYGIYNYRIPEYEPAANYFNVINLDGRFDYSNVDYKGTGTASNISDFILEPRIWFGKDFRMSALRVTPYLGLGYRLLYDKFGEVYGGYDRVSQYLYAPVGMEIALPPLAQWHTVLNPEFDIFIHGWQQSRLGDSFDGYPNITNDQSKGYGARGSIQFWRNFDSFTFSLTPYVRYWNIKKSNTVTKKGTVYTVTGYEPANTSLEVGARIGVQY